MPHFILSSHRLHPQSFPPYSYGEPPFLIWGWVTMKNCETLWTAGELKLALSCCFSACGKQLQQSFIIWSICSVRGVNVVTCRKHLCGVDGAWEWVSNALHSRTGHYVSILVNLCHQYAGLLWLSIIPAGWHNTLSLKWQGAAMQGARLELLPPGRQSQLGSVSAPLTSIQLSVENVNIHWLQKVFRHLRHTCMDFTTLVYKMCSQEYVLLTENEK